MSCAYRRAASLIATIAGIPPDLMLTAMDIARQRRVTLPTLPPDRLRTIAPRLGITPTCGNPQQVIARIQSALIALGTLYPSQPWVERGMAIAAALGVPDDHLPVPVHPEIMATVRAQWAAPPPDPAPNRATAGIAALWRGDPIPDELIDEAIRAKDRKAIVTWMAYGVWDDRFEAICQNLTDAEIGTIVRAGVVTDAIADQAVQWWWSDNLPWDTFPLTMWERVADPETAREGRARTAAAKLIRNPALRDDQLIAAVTQQAHWTVTVLIKRPDLRTDERLITTVAQDARSATEVLVATDLCDERLIVTVANSAPWNATDVLINRADLRTDPRLIAAVKEMWAADVLAATDLCDDRLIAAAADTPEGARRVLVVRHDLSDARLIAAVAKNAKCARDVLRTRHDLSDDCLIAAVIKAPSYVRDVLNKRPDLHTDARLLAVIAQHPHLFHNILKRFPKLRNHPLLSTNPT